MFARAFVVYELHLLHVMRPQMNLDWFGIWTFSPGCA